MPSSIDNFLKSCHGVREDVFVILLPFAGIVKAQCGFKLAKKFHWKICCESMRFFSSILKSGNLLKILVLEYFCGWSAVFRAI